MNTVNMSNGSQTIIPTFITNIEGEGVLNLTPTFVLKCVASALSANVGKFYNFDTSAWNETPHENPLPAVGGIAGAYAFTFSQATIGTPNDSYFVRVNTTIEPTSDHATLLTYGSGVEDTISAIHEVVAPAREEIHRITNDVVEIAYFNAQDVEVSRFRVTHDPSGAQPEQIKEEV